MFGVVVIIKPTNADFQVESLLVGAAIFTDFSNLDQTVKGSGVCPMVTVQHLCYLVAGLFLSLNHDLAS